MSSHRIKSLKIWFQMSHGTNLVATLLPSYCFAFFVALYSGFYLFIYFFGWLDLQRNIKVAAVKLIYKHADAAISMLCLATYQGENSYKDGI